MIGRPLCITGLLASIVLVLGTVRAAPGRHPPPTYDCEPGMPDPSTGACACPEGYEPRVHVSKVPFCRKAAGDRPRPVSIAATGAYHGPPGFDRGMQTTRHCGNRPGSWVRASANLDTRNSVVAVELQLETESTTAGPKGRVAVEVHGARGELLVTIESTEVGIGGTPPGQALRRTYPARVALRAALVKRAAALTIRVACTGTLEQPHGSGGPTSPELQLATR